MKKLVTVTEVEGEGFDALLGEQVMLFGLNYIYAGELIGVNDEFVQIKGARIVYETGPFTQTNYKDAQTLPGDVWYVQKTGIESFGRGK